MKDKRIKKYLIIDGKRKWFTGKTEADVLQKMREYKEGNEKGKTFAQVAYEWERRKYEEIEYTTMARYKSLVAHLTDWFGKDYIKTIKPKAVELFINDYTLKKGFSAKSARHQLSVLNMIFKFAYIQGYIDSIPSEYISVPQKAKKSVQRQALTEQEVDLVQNNANSEMGLFAYILLNSGLRRGELLALKHGDVDYDNKLIYVSKSVYHISNAPYIKSTKTAAGDRKAVFVGDINKIPKGKKDDFIFSENDGPLTKRYIDREWERYTKAINLKVTMHQFRHSYATLLYEAGVDLKTAQYLMGHADITTTQNIYTHVRQTKIDETSKVIELFANKRYKNQA